MLTATGSNSVLADDIVFNTTNLVPGSAALMFTGTTQINGGNGNQFGDGLRCVGGPVNSMGVRSPDAGGNATWGPGYAAQLGWSSGDTRTFQTWYRDTAAGSPCGAAFNLSHGVSITLTP